MKKENILSCFGMTEQQLIEESKQTKLTEDEIELFNKGKDFLDKCKDINNDNSRKRVSLCLLGYLISIMNGDK